jgi:hypothetical protein
MDSDVDGEDKDVDGVKGGGMIDGVRNVIGGLLICSMLIMHLQGSLWFPVVLAYLSRLQCPQHGRLRKTVKEEGTAPVSGF